MPVLRVAVIALAVLLAVSVFAQRRTQADLDAVCAYVAHRSGQEPQIGKGMDPADRDELLKALELAEREIEAQTGTKPDLRHAKASRAHSICLQGGSAP